MIFHAKWNIVGFLENHAPVVLFKPFIENVRLLAWPGGVACTENGVERTWDALWDTGAPITIIPERFVVATGSPPWGKSRPMGSFDPGTGMKRHNWYFVTVSIPGMPDIRIEAIAPRDPDNKRKHITLGCNVLSRLTAEASSNLDWQTGEPQPGQDHEWRWSYQ